MNLFDALQNIDIKQAFKEETTNDIIQKFVEELKKEWTPYYYVGKVRKKRKPVSFMGVKMKLYAIRNNKELLREYFSECIDYRNRHGSFSKRFYGGFKEQSNTG